MVLNDRRQAILELIVDDYIRTAAPVPSQQVVRRHSLRVSSATVRNDMAELEEMGYIRRPHASAGGVPADLGYRFYVEQAVVGDRPPAQLEALAGQA
ncbi:MAG: DeoR family transcriptional regulator, partial [Chloroflexota bacterium]|nr:DeoR family transcriptional regulator [Chloroflexota bacterium]